MKCEKHIAGPWATFLPEFDLKLHKEPSNLWPRRVSFFAKQNPRYKKLQWTRDSVISGIVQKDGASSDATQVENFTKKSSSLVTYCSSDLFAVRFSKKKKSVPDLFHFGSLNEPQPAQEATKKQNERWSTHPFQHRGDGRWTRFRTRVGHRNHHHLDYSVTRHWVSQKKQHQRDQVSEFVQACRLPHAGNHLPQSTFCVGRGRSPWRTDAQPLHERYHWESASSRPRRLWRRTRVAAGAGARTDPAAAAACCSKSPHPRPRRPCSTPPQRQRWEKFA